MLNINGFITKKLLEIHESEKFSEMMTSMPDSFFCGRIDGMKTLGAASYIDIKNEHSSKYWVGSGKDIEYYLDKAKVYNPILLTFFQDLYCKLCKFFEKEFKVKCILHDIAAIPGFHIYDNLYKFSNQQNHIPHFDGQYEGLASLFGLQINERDLIENFLHKTLSFTIPISLPNNTCGLRVWDYHYLDTLEDDKEKAKQKLRTANQRIINYKIGHIVYHSGNYLHQIKSWSCTENEIGRRRITLQGHGLLNNDFLYLYW